MEQPQEVEDEEHERVYERVAAIDVAKKDGMVCVRGPHRSRPGTFFTARALTSWTFSPQASSTACQIRQ